MFILQSVEYQQHGTQRGFLWFVAEGRSITEIATIYQKGFIKKTNIKPYGNKLLVRLMNSNNLSFKIGDAYYLDLTNDYTNNNQVIRTRFTSNDYVAKWYRLSSDEITTQTWQELYSTEFNPNYTITVADNCTGLRPQTYTRVYNSDDKKNKISHFMSYLTSINTSEEQEYGSHEVATPEPETPPEESNQTDDDFDPLLLYGTSEFAENFIDSVNEVE